MDLGALGIDRGGHLLVARALQGLAPGDTVEVRGHDQHLGLHLAAWARGHGHRAEGMNITKGKASDARWNGAERAGVPGPTVWEKAPLRWGLAARGALVEAGGPDLSVADLDTKAAVWSDLAPRLYA
ncbi:MAG: hypothetical protein QOK20_1014, partial [Acidimicrobiaceae bacterium]|nr:hypothetical protein [Acidimicrobiaceae bacterium]